MSDREDLRVNGYCFGSLQDAKEAGEESRKIEYFREKTRGRTGGNLLAFYDKLLDEKVFKTPIGWEYLKQLREEILKSGISPDQVRPITLHTGFTYRVQEDAQKAAARQAEAIAQRKEKKDYRFRISLCVNFLLAVLVAFMFLITLKSDNPNILNYKQVLTNQYASWEQNLTERENRIREKEQELLDISYPAKEITDTKEE